MHNFVVCRKGSFIGQLSSENTNTQKDTKSEEHFERQENNKNNVLKQLNNRVTDNPTTFTNNKSDKNRESWIVDKHSEDNAESLKSKLTLQFDENFESFLREEEVEMEEEIQPVENIHDTRFLRNKGSDQLPNAVPPCIDLPASNDYNHNQHSTSLLAGHTYTVNFSASSQSTAPEKRNKVENGLNRRVCGGGGGCG